MRETEREKRREKKEKKYERMPKNKEEVDIANKVARDSFHF